MTKCNKIVEKLGFLGQNMIFGLMMNLYGYKITTNCYINMADCFAINVECI